MGCASSKQVENNSVVTAKIQFLGTLREVTQSLSNPYDAEKADEHILNAIDSELRMRFLDASIGSVVAVNDQGVIEESQLASGLKALCDDAVLSQCMNSERRVDCYELLSKIAMSSKFVAFPCKDASRKYICHAFKDEKSYSSFLYDLSSKVNTPANVCDYSISFAYKGAEVLVSAVENSILDSIPSLQEDNAFAGSWSAFCVKNGKSITLSEEPVEMKPVEEVKPTEEVKEVKVEEVKPAEEAKVEEAKEEEKPEEKPAEEVKEGEKKPLEKPVVVIEEPSTEPAKETATPAKPTSPRSPGSPTSPKSPNRNPNKGYPNRGRGKKRAGRRN